MKPVLPIAMATIGFLTLWIFSDYADAKEVEIVKVTIIDKEELLKKCGSGCNHIKLGNLIMKEITKESK